VSIKEKGMDVVTFQVQTMTDVLYFAIWYCGMFVSCVGLIAILGSVVYKSISAFSIGLVALIIGTIPFIKGLQLMGFI